MQSKINKYKKRIDNCTDALNVRSRIVSAFADLYFKENTHQYYLFKSGKRIELPSVSNITHLFQQKQDWDAIALNYAIKHEMLKEEVQAAWRWNNLKATNSGSNVHVFGESAFYFYQGNKEAVMQRNPNQFEEDWLLPNSGKEEAILSFWENEIVEKDNIIPLLSESRIYTLKYGYAGTFDLSTWDIEKGGVYIRDYKTNADVYKNFNLQRLLSPFEDLLDCDYSFYTLQLSLYQIPLEDLGIPILGRQLIWLKEDGSYELLEVEDRTKELRNYLKK